MICRALNFPCFWISVALSGSLLQSIFTHLSLFALTQNHFTVFKEVLSNVLRVLLGCRKQLQVPSVLIPLLQETTVKSSEDTLKYFQHKMCAQCQGHHVKPGSKSKDFGIAAMEMDALFMPLYRASISQMPIGLELLLKGSCLHKFH